MTESEKLDLDNRPTKTVHLANDLHYRLRLLALDRNLSVREALNNAVTEYLDAQEPTMEITRK